MRSRRLLAAAVLLLAATGSASAQNIAFSVRVAGPPGLAVGTRQIITASLVVTNGPAARTLLVEPALPAGWRVVAGGDPFTLEPGAEDLRLVSILVPSGAPAGQHLLRFTVRELRDDGVSATVEIPVAVREEPGLSLHLLERPPFVIAGATYTASFMLVNTGNVAIHPVLSARENLGLLPELPSTPDRLEPGDQIEIPIAVTTDARFRDPVIHRLILSVWDRTGAADATNVPPLAQASYRVEIVPLSTAGAVPMHTLRLDSLTAGRLSYSGELDASLKESLSLTGTLDEAGEHRIEADIVKLLDTGFDPLVTPEDRYSVNWSHRLGNATLGDSRFDLSPLLAESENGRGLRGAFTPRGMRFGAMYFFDPWSGAAEQWLGALLGARFPRDRREDQAVYRVDAAVRWPLADVVGFDLLQRLRPMPGVDVLLDTALQVGGSGAIAPAILTEASAAFDRIQGNLRFLRAWPDFDAEYSDTQSLSASAASILLDGDLKLSGSFSMTDTNLLRDPGLPSASRTITATLHANGMVPRWGSRPSLSARLTSQRDLLPSPDYDWLDGLLSLSWAQKFDALDIRVSSTMDRKIDRLGGHWTTTLTDGISASWNLGQSLGMSTSLQYYGRLQDVGQPWHTIGWKIGARGSSPTTRVEGAARTTWTFSDTGFSRFLVGLSASGSHRFPWGHSIQGTVDASVARDLIEYSPAFSLSLGYRAATDIPLYRKRDSSAVRGRVFLEETGTPWEGVLLRLNGLAAITDSSGEYVFNIPKSGAYHLQVDRGTLGRGKIPSRATPIEVDAAPRSVTVVDIGIVEAASLSGTVTMWGYPERGAFTIGEETDAVAAEPVNLGGLGNLVLELRNGADPVRRLSNRDGRFEFTEIRPGRYTLAVISGLIPAYHRVEQETYVVELAPGENGVIEIRVIQEQRRIRMVETGTLEVIEAPRAAGEFTVPERTPLPTLPTPAEPAVAQPAPAEPAPVPPSPIEPTPIQPTPAEPAPVPPSPIEPAPTSPAPTEPQAAPVVPQPAPSVAPPVEPTPAPAVPSPVILSTWLPPPIVPSEPQATSTPGAPAVAPARAAAPSAPAAPTAPTAPAPAAPAVPAAPAPAPAKPAAPAPPAPPVTIPAAKPPTAAAPVAPAAIIPAPTIPAPTPTPPPIAIPIPVPTPRPPVIVPAPAPTPQPFPP